MLYYTLDGSIDWTTRTESDECAWPWNLLFFLSLGIICMVQLIACT